MGGRKTGKEGRDVRGRREGMEGAGRGGEGGGEGRRGREIGNLAPQLFLKVGAYGTHTSVCRPGGNAEEALITNPATGQQGKPDGGTTTSSTRQ